MSRAVEASPACVMITDRAGNIEYVNPRFAEATGYSFSEVVGRNPRLLNSGQLPQEHHRRMFQNLLRDGEWSGEFCNRKKDGTLFWWRSHISTIHAEDGDLTHFVAVAEDITEHKRAADELRAARERAEHADRAKAALLQELSLEIAPPLHSIAGLAQLLRDDPDLSDEHRRLLERICRDADRLLELTTDLAEVPDAERAAELRT